MTTLAHEFSWGDTEGGLTVSVDETGRTRLTSFGGSRREAVPFDAASPLAELITPARSALSGPRYDRTDLGLDLRYANHVETEVDGVPALEVELHDPASSLVAVVRYTMRPGSGTLSSSVHIANAGDDRPVVVLFASSFAFGGAWPVAGTRVHSADNDWLAEFRWRQGTWAEVGEPDIDMAAHAGSVPRGALVRTGRGTWSTATALPMGALERADGDTMLWQIESNGGWRWQLAQNLGDAADGVFSLVTSGPTDADNQWSLVLGPGEGFTTPVTTVAVSDGGFDGALARLTAHRRADRTPYLGDAGLPLIYNDYMNTLMADPTTEKLLPLISAAGRAGAEIFVVDAGWYTDETSWWDTVGGWEASTSRFPGGFGLVFDAIRDARMIPGLWLEPEVVGVNSPAAGMLPDSAFFTRHGARLVDNGRYQLDYRHPAVIARMDAVIDRLVADYGIGYVKFDYNIDPESGTDQRASSPGAGLYDAAEAFLRWIDGVHARHPRLIVEDCASGGMRADWRTVSHFALLSTSDQQNALRVVPIAANAPTAVPPEQAGVWSYPEHGMEPGVAVVTLANSLLRRPILSGNLDGLDDAELSRVQEFTSAHKRIRPELPGLLPVSPTGPAGWEDPWATWALVGPEVAYVAAVRRDPESPASIRIPLGQLADGRHCVGVERVFPSHGGEWTLGSGVLEVCLDAPSALILRLTRG